MEKKSLKDLAEAVEVRTTQLSSNKAKVHQFTDVSFRPQATSNAGARYRELHFFNFTVYTFIKPRN